MMPGLVYQDVNGEGAKAPPFDVEALDEVQARAGGSLVARAATTDIVDACVVEGAIRRRDVVVSSDPDDLQAIAAAVSRRLEIDRP
jgi:hypothetical protein